MNKVFLTGMPRCRSGWFANFLTYGNRFVYHDGFLGCDSFNDFTRRMMKSDGNSDPANVFFWEHIHREFPNARWVVVERPMSEVLASVNRIVPVSVEMLTNMGERLIALKEKLNPLIVDFHKITPEVAREIGDYCGIDTGPFIRAAQLCRMNIQVDPRKLQSMIMETIAKPPHIFKEAA